MKTACKKAGIPYGRNQKNGFTYHDLIHTFNTNMRKAGVHDSVLMEITGHSTREMFDRYNTVDAAISRTLLRNTGRFCKTLDKMLDTMKNATYRYTGKPIKKRLLTVSPAKSLIDEGFGNAICVKCWCRRRDLNSHRHTPTRP